MFTIHTERSCCLQVVKKPGQDNTPIMSEMDLTYKERYTEAYIPEAYERLILDAIRGDQQHFVRRYHCDSNACMIKPCQAEHRSPTSVLQHESSFSSLFFIFDLSAHAKLFHMQTACRKDSEGVSAEFAGTICFASRRDLHMLLLQSNTALDTLSMCCCCIAMVHTYVTHDIAWDPCMGYAKGYASPTSWGI